MSMNLKTTVTTLLRGVQNNHVPTAFNTGLSIKERVQALDWAMESLHIAIDYLDAERSWLNAGWEGNDANLLEPADGQKAE